MPLTQITYQREEAVAYISLNRPEKLNALTPTMMEELRSVLADIQQDDSCRIVVIKGEGKAWSAGVDLSVFQEIKVEPGFKMWQDGDAVIKMLENMPQVTICQLNGYCFTGAMELMLGFDLILAADEAQIGDTHTKWGILPKWGMTQRLMNQVGMRKAKELSFTAQAVSGEEAERIGLVNKSVPLAQLQECVDDMVEQILDNSSQTIKAVKEMYQFGNTHSLPEGIQFELDYEADLTDKSQKLKDFKKNIGKS
ncbi:MAG: enoyl-CoA hydratase/isomerase family protein [Bacteroidota bacterium]